MKYKYIYIVALLLCTTQVFGQKKLDRSKAPKPGKAPQIKIGKAETFTLDNGLKVFVIESHKSPKVSYSLSLDFAPFLEGDKAGSTAMVGELMRAGTTTRSKVQIDNQIDFLGASLYPSSRGISGSCLKKHNTKLLDLMSDVLFNPIFPQKELDKVVKRTLSNIKNQASDAGAIASNVKNILKYGKNHPYGELVTAKTVKNIKVKDLKQYYNTYFKPNIAYLVIVGDITLKEAKPLVTKYFGKWEKGNVENKTFSTPKMPTKTQVALVEKAGAVQTDLSITYPIEYSIKSDDYLTASLMNQILGAGGSRLFLNLREDKGYTYGAYSSLSQSQYIGSFTASAKVRNSVTDSATTEFMNELRRIRDEKVSPEELKRAKAVMAGGFARSMESPSTIASMALNKAKYNLPADFYTTYLQKIEAITAEDIQAAAKKYIKPENAYIVAVGDVNAIKSSMKKFGKVTIYDIYGNVDTGAGKASLKNMTVDKLFNKYFKATGGLSKMKAVKSMTSTMTLSIQGQTIEFINHQKSGKFASIQNTPYGKMKTLYNGKKGYSVSPKGTTEIKGDELKKLKNNGVIFPVVYYKNDGKKYELTNSKVIDGQNAYEVTITENGVKTLVYFNAKTGHMVCKIANKMEITFKDHKKNASGLMLPSKMSLKAGPQVLNGTVKTEINPTIADKTFEK